MKKTILASALSLPLLGGSCFGIGDKVTDQITDKIAEQATEKVLESATGTQDVEIEGETVSIEGENGEKLEIGTQELPQDIPSVVPVYTGAQPQSSFSTGEAQGDKGWTVTLASDDSITLVNGYYAQALNQNGWEVTYQYSLDESYGYVAKNGLLTVTLTISANESDQTSIFMSVSESSKFDESEE